MIRRRGESIADSIEIKTELQDDLDHVLDTAEHFIENTINDLDESEGEE